MGSLLSGCGETASAAQVTLKDPKEFKLIGKPMKRLDTPEKINGKAVFGIDVKIRGCLRRWSRALRFLARR